MTTFAPASASILTVPSPRPEAPPVTMNVLPLSRIEFPLAFLCRFLLLRHEPRPVAQQRIHAVLRDEISPALELFLALELLDELLAVLVECFVVLRFVLGFFAFGRSSRFTRLASNRDAD